MKWQVLEWNEPAINFYKKYDAILEREWWNGKLEVGRRELGGHKVEECTTYNGQRTM
jgi:hypothetical protein